MIDQPVSMQLTQDDVAKLMADPSGEVRAETTAKIASQFEMKALSPAERQIAEEIFRRLVKDAEVRVREALTSHLKNSPELPHDVALALAKDVDSVSLPMIKFSEVLTDADLIEIVRDQGDAKQVAVAQRPSVSTCVADALIDTGNEKAPSTLASRVFDLDSVVEARIHEDGSGLVVSTRDAGRFFLLLNKIVVECDLRVEAVTPADDDVHAVYQYLIGDEREGS